MTGNKITLYKVPWAFIKIGYNYEIECVCNIDITVAQDYNFGIITYNNHDYYADVIDMEMVNVNRTRIQFRRNAIIENTNYLHHFKNFTISKITLKPDKMVKAGVMRIDQTIDKKFLFSDFFRTYKRNIEIDLKSYKSPINGYNNIVELPAIVILATYEQDWDSRNIAKYYGEGCGYRIGIIPLPFFNNPVNENNVYKYNMRVAAYFIGPSNPFDYSLFSYDVEERQFPATGSSEEQSQFYELLASLSPYTCQAMFTKVIAFKGDDTEAIPGAYCLPFKYYGITSKLYPNSDVGAHCFWVENTTSYNSETLEVENQDFYFDINYNLADHDVSDAYFKKLNFKFFNSSQQIEIDVRDFIGLDENGTMVCNIHCELKQFFSMLGSQLLVSFYSQSQSGSIENNKLVYSKVISFGDSTNITVEASANFNANNRYYMSMANNAIEQKQTAAFTQAIGQFATGATQMIGGFLMPASASVAATGSYSMGIGNIIRGITSTVQAHTDAAYERERARLYKKNEEAKPDTVEGNYSAASAYHSISVGLIACIEISPFEEDYKHWLNDSKIYGYECELFEQTLDVASLADGDNFALSAIAEVSDDTLSAREYSEMYEFLKQCNYKVYS